MFSFMLSKVSNHSWNQAALLLCASDEAECRGSTSMMEQSSSPHSEREAEPRVVFLNGIPVKSRC